MKSRQVESVVFGLFRLCRLVDQKLTCDFKVLTHCVINELLFTLPHALVSTETLHGHECVGEKTESL